MIYLNNSATSFPKPKTVVDSITGYLNSIPFTPYRSGRTQCNNDIISNCRKNISELFGITLNNQVIFTSGATESLNLAIKGLDYSQKNHVVTTNIEHNSVLRPLKHLESEGIINFSIVDCDETGIVSPQNINLAINNNSRAIVINHCSNVTGTVQNLVEISQIAKNNGLVLIVDASQSAGIIDIDVEKLGIDVLVFTGHKSLYGPQGIGGFYIREGLDIKPLKTGGTGIKSDLEFQPKEIPLYYEAGTQNIPGIVGLGAGVEFILNTGINNIRQRNEVIYKKITDYLLQLSAITVYQPSNIINASCSLVSFTINGMSVDDIHYMLENSFDIIVRSGLHCAPLIHRSIGTEKEGTVRISWSHFTTDQEIDTFLGAITEILKCL
jgi:cysteine desulfurase family protein